MCVNIYYCFTVKKKKIVLIYKEFIYEEGFPNI